MLLTHALIVYFLGVIVIYLILYYFALMTPWSALILTLLFGGILLMSLASIVNVDRSQGEFELWLYMAIGGVTLLLLLIYIIERALRDRDVSIERCSDLYVK